MNMIKVTRTWHKIFQRYSRLSVISRKQDFFNTTSGFPSSKSLFNLVYGPKIMFKIINLKICK